MTQWPLSVALPLTLLGSVLLVLAYDAVSAAMAARNPSFPYRNLWPLQFALYIVIGFVSALTLLDPRLVGVVGAVTGFVDGTAGLALAWRIGPGPVVGTTKVTVAVLIFSMTAFGFGLALLGAWVFVLVAGAVIRAHHG